MNRAVFVAAGILVSRLAGLLRLRAFAHYFGLRSDAADAFNAAFRIPNVLQNLFGEGALSASFIPVYAALVAKGERREADRVAGAVGALLALAVACLVLLGVVVTPALIAVIAPGFVEEKRALTISLVRILFPGAGLLVMSAWCLGVLNSHRRFLLSYAAPVMWNAAMITTLVVWGSGAELSRLAMLLAWGSVAGSALQFAVQVPTVLRVAPDVRFSLDLTSTSGHVRTVVRNFLPVFVSRGAVQLSAYVDTMLASLLPMGAVTALANAQIIYTLPVSLFGMSVAAAELPDLASAAASDGALDTVRARLEAALTRVAFFVVPSAMAFLALGDVIAAALLQTGRFSHEDATFVWVVLTGSTVGLLASTVGRLYSSTYYALRDTHTPLRYALARIVLTTVLGYVCALPLPRWLGIDPLWGTVGLTASAGVAGWVEMILLRRTLSARIGSVRLERRYLGGLWAASACGALVAWGVKLVLPPLHPMVAAMCVLGVYGLAFLAATFALGMPDVLGVRARLGAQIR